MHISFQHSIKCFLSLFYFYFFSIGSTGEEHCTVKLCIHTIKLCIRIQNYVSLLRHKEEQIIIMFWVWSLMADCSRKSKTYSQTFFLFHLISKQIFNKISYRKFSINIVNNKTYVSNNLGELFKNSYGKFNEKYEVTYYFFLHFCRNTYLIDCRREDGEESKKNEFELALEGEWRYVRSCNERWNHPRVLRI